MTDDLHRLADRLEEAQSCRRIPGLKNAPLHYCPNCDNSIKLSGIIADLRALASHGTGVAPSQLALNREARERLRSFIITHAESQGDEDELLAMLT